MSILDQLWQGEIAPALKPITPGGEYEVLLGKYADLDTRLRPELTEAQRNTLSEMQSLQAALQEVDSRDSFASGFRLGALLMLEVLDSRKNP